MKALDRTIGKIAQEAGVTVETIRFYERRGLIQQPRKVKGRYRVYSDEILAQVRYIKIAQALGFTLSEVKDLRSQMTQKSTFCSAVEGTVSEKLQAIEVEIQSLQSLKQDLLSFQQRCSKRGSDDCPLYDELKQLGVAVSEFQDKGSPSHRRAMT